MPPDSESRPGPPFTASLPAPPLTFIGMGRDAPWANKSSPPRPITTTGFRVVELASGALQSARVTSPGTAEQPAPMVKAAAASMTTLGAVVVPARLKTTWSRVSIPS